MVHLLVMMEAIIAVKAATITLETMPKPATTHKMATQLTDVSLNRTFMNSRKPVIRIIRTAREGNLEAAREELKTC